MPLLSPPVEVTALTRDLIGKVLITALAADDGVDIAYALLPVSSKVLEFIATARAGQAMDSWFWRRSAWCGEVTYFSGLPELVEGWAEGIDPQAGWFIAPFETFKDVAGFVPARTELDQMHMNRHGDVWFTAAPKHGDETVETPRLYEETVVLASSTT